jgi:hypothetical protein
MASDMELFEFIIFDDDIDDAGSGAGANSPSQGNSQGRHTTFRISFDSYVACSHNATENPIEIEDDQNSTISGEDNASLTNTPTAPVSLVTPLMSSMANRATVMSLATGLWIIVSNDLYIRDTIPRGNDSDFDTGLDEPTRNETEHPQDGGMSVEVLNPPPVDEEDNQYAVESLLDKRARRGREGVLGVERGDCEVFGQRCKDQPALDTTVNREYSAMGNREGAHLSGARWPSLSSSITIVVYNTWII